MGSMFKQPTDGPTYNLVRLLILFFCYFTSKYQLVRLCSIE